MPTAKFSDLLGKTLIEVCAGEGEEQALFKTSEGHIYKQDHQQNCCECVEISEVIGDLDDLLNSPILLAEEVSWDNEVPTEEPKVKTEYGNSWTWTFYKLSTLKGSVTIRWLGESNGYYSEAVDFYLCTEA